MMTYTQDEIIDIALRYQALKRGGKLKGIAHYAYCLKKLCEEVGELGEAMLNANITRQELAAEVGDVQIMLMVIAKAYDLRVDECAERKAKVLVERSKKLSKKGD